MEQLVYQDGNSETVAELIAEFGTADTVCVFMRVDLPGGWRALITVGYADDTYFH